MVARVVSLCLAALLGLRAWAMVDTMPGAFDEHIKSVQVRLEGNDFAMPVVVLGSDDRIRIDFDMLGDDRAFLRYSLTHCNSAWQPSGLSDSEILNGFNEGSIEEYDFSRATTVHYVHYGLTIPNDEIAPKISGNYLLKIYEESDPSATLLQVRFMVSEASAAVSAVASGQTDVDYNKTHQQLAIAVDTENASVEDPFNDIMVVVSQNGRMDNEIAIRQPLRLQGRTAIYEHLPKLIFDAGNEYRRFETVSDTYPGMRVAGIEYLEPYYHYTLETDAARSDGGYSYDQTQYGRFVVREYNSSQSDVEADYGVVYFSLDYPAKPGDMIFLDGDFTQRRFDDNARMMYNPSTGLWERAMLLKQGAYNYQYLVVPAGASRGYTAQVEGDYFPTVNEYAIRVYHRRRGERYDRLIGTYQTVNQL